MDIKEEVLESIRTVEDPEMKISVVDLGLIYDIRVEETENGKHAEIDLTLTSPGCPAAPEIMAAVHRAGLETKEIESVHVNLVWSPRWDPKIHASEDAQFELGIF
ncbi:MAG: metal-sulfur cluster assembly factor [Candidatus Thalassarchaeaceae archaeon]|jgi:metal-sulfur cluster biosynthetic enzyme|nr:metal-sulfur cluster assembly factor [Candidatus Thalassarchaeaceae archaeon]|tara:strand:- start:232 stop:546 length:315 start_codon:yes stop_codon:yes gene_type:complete